MIIKDIDEVETSTWFNLVGDNATRLTRNTAYSANLVEPQYPHPGQISERISSPTESFTHEMHYHRTSNNQNH